MRPFRVVALALAVLALATTATAAARNAPELAVRFKPLRAEIGDPVRADLELVVPAGFAVGLPIFPDWGETWGDAEVAAVTAPIPEPVEGGGTLFRQTVTLVPWSVGELEFPAPSVEIPTASEIVAVTTTRPATLTVTSVLPEGEERPAPKPPAPPLPFPVDASFWWTFGLVFATCLALAALLVARRRGVIGAPGATAIDPLTAFRSALSNLAGKGDPLTLIAGLSLALRRYLSGRLGFPAVESTTTEIRRTLQRRGLSPDLVLGIDRLLKRCDAVKFARQPIARDACDESLAAAGGLADALEAHLRPAPERAEESDGEREAA